MTFVLPSKSQAGVLMNPDLAKEWSGENKTIMSDGTEITYNPPPPKPVMPDWSEIKTIRHYFNRQYKNNFWPAWLYNHETGEERVVRTADEAAELGVCFRERTLDEQSRFGAGNVWDWRDDCKWRPTPKASARKYDPRHPELGKEFVASQVPQSTANRELLNTVLPEVTAAVVAALRQDSQVANGIDPALRDEFLAFMAWKKTQEAIDVVAPPSGLQRFEEVESGGEAPPVLASEAPEHEIEAWRAEAERHGIKIDKRWGLDRLKSEVEKAA